MTQEKPRDRLVSTVRRVKGMVLRWKERWDSQKELLASSEGQERFLQELLVAYVLSVKYHWQRWRFHFPSRTFEDDDRWLPWSEYVGWLLCMGWTLVVEKALLASQSPSSLTPAAAAYKVLTDPDALSRWWRSLLKHPMVVVRDDLAKPLLTGAVAASSRLFPSTEAALEWTGRTAEEELCFAVCEALPELKPGAPIVGSTGSLAALALKKLNRVRRDRPREEPLGAPEDLPPSKTHAVSGAHTPEDMLAREEELQMLRDCLSKAKLSHREREIIGMTMTGLTQEEIGQKLGVRRGTVGKTMQGAIRKLRELALRA